MTLLKNILKQAAEKYEQQFESVVSDFPDLKSNIKYLIRCKKENG